MKNWQKDILIICAIFLPLFIFPLIFDFGVKQIPRFGLYMIIYYTALLAGDIGYRLGKDAGREEAWKEMRNP